MVSLYLIFYACLELRFPDLETNPGPWRPVPGACRILCSNVWGFSKNLSDVTVASAQYDLLFCSETLVSDRRHKSEFLVPGFGHPVLLCRDGVPWARGMAVYVRDGYGDFVNLNLSVAVVRCWYSGCVVLDRTSTCSVCIATLTLMIGYMIVY